MPLVLAVGAFVLMHVALRFHVRQRWLFALLGLVIWSALLASGVDPVVAGLAIGLSASAYSPSRGDLEEATGLVRRFREEPTPELARQATAGLRRTLSPNERLQTFYHPWTSYVIVPLFALANAGIALNARLPGARLHDAGHSRRPHRLRRGQAGRGRRDLMGGDPAQPRPGAPADRVGGRDRQRHHLGHRLHGRAADRDPRVPRCAAGGGQARRAVRGGGGQRPDLGRLPARRAAAGEVAGTRPCSGT